MKYIPRPIETDKVELTPDIEALSELLAKNTHEIWAQGRIREGWVYGPQRNDEKKEHSCLVPYEELPESEKAYDRNVSMETLKVILSLGYEIKKK